MSAVESAQSSRSWTRERMAAKVATALFLIAIAGWVVFLRPANLGGPLTYVIVSGESMEPTLFQEDLAVVRKQSSYAPGDVIAFKVAEGEAGQGAIVIHRILEEGPDGYVMQGDNKPIPDIWTPVDDEITGKLWFHVDGAGKILAFGRSPLILALFAAALAFVLVVTVPFKPRASADTEEPAPE
jgi:signal peptidase I